ncbi:MAG: hypothetical protein ACFB2Z_01700 [Maricaulaceae bacterium]
MARMISALVLFCALASPQPAFAQAPPPADQPPVGQAPAPTPEALAAIDQLEALINQFAQSPVTRQGQQTAFFEFTIEGVTVTAIADPSADRMRFFAPAAPASALDAALATRLLQANFDTALDARYAIAQGFVFATFVHPLTSLTLEDAASGLAQTVTLVRTFGSSFSSGALSFGGGDSQEQLVQEFLRQLDRAPPPEDAI